ncbi:hypothetical protein OF83DRAFT_80480 [Amylostereum chailletii]|nr:hypothetical protein OF83DRAFT_80480 [Amylostereum chailletii]
MSDAQWAPRQLGSSTSGGRMAATALYDPSPPPRRRALPPPPITTYAQRRPALTRSASVVSVSTHDDLTSIGELLSPVIARESEFAALQEQETLPLDDALEARLHGRSGLPRLLLETDNIIPPGPSPTSSKALSETYDDIFDQEYLSISGGSSVYNRSSILSSTPSSWHRDSDTPSLTSSTSRSSLSSYSHFSPPVSPGPASLVHAIDAGDPIPFLSTINEDGYPSKSRLSTISVMTKASALIAPTPEDIKQMPSPETMRIKTASPVETVVCGRASPTPSGSSSPFNTVFGRTSGAVSGTGTSVSDKSTMHSIAVDAKTRKAQEKAELKKSKKEEARARKERLAAEFAAKANRNKETDGHSSYSNKSDQRKNRKAAWEEENTMYGGVSDMVA